MKKEFREVKTSKIYKGFHLKEGFYVDESFNEVITGLDPFNEGKMTGFFLNDDAEWERCSFDANDAGADEIFNDFLEKEKNIEWNEVLALKPQEKLHVENNEIKFVDVVPGDKCNDGGEYGFYTVLVPTEVGGLYEEFTCTTCSFDDCGTGREGYKWLTETEYCSLKEESERIQVAGSLY